MIASIEQFEIHMCCGATAEEKKERFLELRDVLDAEMAKLTPQTSSATKRPPTPPPMPPMPNQRLTTSEGLL